MIPTNASLMSMPESLRQALLAHSGIVVTLVAIKDEVAIIAKAPARDVDSFRDASIQYEYKLALYEEGPVLLLAVNFLNDDQEQFFRLETLFDVNKPSELALAETLANQSTIALHLYDHSLIYQFTKTFAQRLQFQCEVQALIERAVEHLKTIAEPDWHAARERFTDDVAW